jgi:hypothetical protein
MLAMLGLVGSCLSLTQMFLLELRELEHISWTFWEVPLLVTDIISVSGSSNHVTCFPIMVIRQLNDGYNGVLRRTRRQKVSSGTDCMSYPLGTQNCIKGSSRLISQWYLRYLITEALCLTAG